MLEVVRKSKALKESVAVAEIGVGIGATTLEILKVMNGSGSLHLFDFDDKVLELAADIREGGFDAGIEVLTYGNGTQTFNSYAWTLANLILSLRNSGQSTELFDCVYLDGAHAFQHDAPACVILNNMIKPGGFLVFDDVNWTFNKSPTVNPLRNPSILERYSAEQLDTPHVDLIIKVFMDSDDRFERVSLGMLKSKRRAVFRRV